MSAHLVSTPIKIGQCARCQGYVFTCQSGGLRVAADPAPLDVEQYRAALIAGKRVYRLLEHAGRPFKLEADHPSVPHSGAPLLAAHGCGAIALDAPKVEEIPETPQVSVCEAWSAQGWNPPKSCPRRVLGATVASCGACEPPPFDRRGANDHPMRSELPLCVRCRRFFDDSEDRWSVDIPGKAMWTAHYGACPPKRRSPT